MASVSRERHTSSSAAPPPPNYRPALKKSKRYTRKRVLIIGTLLPEILEPAIPRGVDENVTLQEPYLSPETVLAEVKNFLESDKDTYVHIIFSDFGGILPRDDSAPRIAQTLLRDCHRELMDRCAYTHDHQPSEMCWVTVLNYYATTKMFGHSLPPRIRETRVDFLNRVSTAIASVGQDLPQMHLMEITRFITTNTSALFFPGSHAPRDQLKD